MERDFYEEIRRVAECGPPARIEHLVSLTVRYEEENVKHLLFANTVGQTLIETCLRLVPEDVLAELVRALAASDPDFFRRQNYKPAETFLHLALERQSSLSIIDLFAAKEAVAEEGWCGTPLHMACRGRHEDGRKMSAYYSEVIHLFLDRNPDALMVPDRTGRLPLHEAFEDMRMRLDDDSFVSVVRRMVRLHPEALCHEANDGFTPILVAFRNDVDESLLLDLVRESPRSVRCLGTFRRMSGQVSGRGEYYDSNELEYALRCGLYDGKIIKEKRTCLHHACSSSSYTSAEMFRILINEFPIALAVFDRSRRLPFEKLAERVDELSAYDSYGEYSDDESRQSSGRSVGEQFNRVTARMAERETRKVALATFEQMLSIGYQFRAMPITATPFAKGIRDAQFCAMFVEVDEFMQSASESTFDLFRFALGTHLAKGLLTEDEHVAFQDRVEDQWRQNNKFLAVSLVECILHDTFSNSVLKEHVKDFIHLRIPNLSNERAESCNIRTLIRENECPRTFCLELCNDADIHYALNNDESFHDVVSGLYRSNKLHDRSKNSPSDVLRAFKAVNDNLTCIFLIVRCIDSSGVIFPNNCVSPGKSVDRTEANMEVPKRARHIESEAQVLCRENQRLKQKNRLLTAGIHTENRMLREKIAKLELENRRLAQEVESETRKFRRKIAELKTETHRPSTKASLE